MAREEPQGLYGGYPTTRSLSRESVEPARAVLKLRGRLRERAGSVPPTSLVLLAILSMQIGSATAKGLFETVGPAGAVFLRVGVAAVLCTAIWRLPPRGLPRSYYVVAALFGLVLGGMNLCFYLALDRIPLGVAVTLEFTGPLSVAILGSRRVLDLVWGVLAVGGILLLSPLAAFGAGASPPIDPVGAGFALLAGCLWASYILLGGLVGRSLGSGTGLALSTCVAAVALAPVGIASGGANLLRLEILLGGLAIALLSTAIPYSLELEALKNIPARVFGVLMSLEPAAAALIGFVALSEEPGARSLAAIVLVTVAAAGSSAFRGKSPS
jgi:inner membrane transporter RhtA